MAAIQIELPEPKKQQLKDVANQEGITLTALCRRVLFLYMRDPLAFHHILFEKTQPARRTRPGGGFYG